MVKRTPILFLGKPIGFFLSSCFYFFIFLFPQMFLLLIEFVNFTVSSLLLLLQPALQIWESIFFLLGVFYLAFLPDIWHNLLLSRLPWGRQYNLEGCRAYHWGSKLRPHPSVCLNYTVFSSYMISVELYLNLSKYVDKLLVVKSFK